MGNDAIGYGAQFPDAGGLMETSSNYTQQDPDDSASQFAARQFQINRTLTRVRTMVLVKVVAISGGAGAIASPGTVNVQPLVKIVDGQNNVSSHGVIQNVPVYRLGGGNNAIICDPVVGDIGWMAIADRDSSVVVKTKAEAQPGSRRKFDLADGVYMGSILSSAPTQYITFTSSGVTIADSNGNKIVMSAGGVNINGFVINSSGDAVTGSGVDVANHVHTGGTLTGALTGPPVP